MNINELLEKRAAEFLTMNASFEQRITAALSHFGKGSPTSDHSIPDCNQKSEYDANEVRACGNKVLNSAPYEALTWYTKSIAMAPEKSEVLSFGYANRAVVLEAMGHNFDAIADNQRAIKFGYPEKLQYKVLARLGKCYEKVGQYGRALTCLNAALEGVNNSDLKEEDKGKFRSDYIQPFLDACDAAGEEDEEDLKDWTEEPLIGVNRVEVPTLDGDENAELPSASSSVALKYNSKFGRHLVATKDIELGEIVMVEEPYAAYLIEPKNYEFCHHCLKKCRTLQPCFGCCWAMFCSNACKAEAKSYHKLECIYFLRAFQTARENPINKGLANGYLLAVRLLTRYGLEAVTKYPESAFDERVFENDEERRTAGFNENGKYDPTDVNTILNLCLHPIKDNYNETPISNNVLMYCHYFTIAALMMFFKLNTDSNYIKIAKFIFTFASSYSYSGCSTLVEYNVQNEQDVTDTVFAEGIYPTYALINQNCTGNVYSIFHGKTLVVRAFRTIKKGCQLFVSRLQFPNYPLKERQKFNLDRYCFKCTCKACEQNWPLFHNLPEFPFHLPGARKCFKTINTAYSNYLKSVTKHKNSDICNVLEESLPHLRNYVTLLESKNLTLCGAYYSALYDGRRYYFKLGSHIGKITDREVPLIAEKDLPIFVYLKGKNRFKNLKKAIIAAAAEFHTLEINLITK